MAEAVDWLAALALLGAQRLDEAAAVQTLAAVLKYHEDQAMVAERGLPWLVSGHDG